MHICEALLILFRRQMPQHYLEARALKAYMSHDSRWILQESDSPRYQAAHVQAGTMASTDRPDLAADLRAASDILKRLESAIAAVKPSAQGFTAPGAYLMQLLGSVGAPAKQCRMLAHMLLTASTTGGEASSGPSSGAEAARYAARGTARPRGVQ